GGVPEARVQVEARAGLAHVPLRHERDRDALLVRDLLRAVLVDDVVVGRRDRLAVAKVDLLLPRAPLALATLDDDSRSQHAVADLAADELLLARLQDVVVLGVRADRLEAAISLPAGALVGVAEEDELELRGDQHPEAQRRRPLDLAPENAAGRLLDRPVTVVLHVAEDEGRPLEPRDAAHRREVADRVEVLVARPPPPPPTPP